jgi:hypothetical protein
MASPEEMAQSMRDNIPQKTGKPIADWFSIISKSQLEKHGQIVKLLKEQHGVTHGFANLITSGFLQRGQQPAAGTDLIEAQYSGAKQPLKTIYTSIIKQLTHLKDLEIAPKKTYVSLRHNKQFAIIQPSTKTRVDIGVNLPGESATERLELAGSFNAMVSHRVRVTDTSQIDDELIGWMIQAYKES